MLSNSTSHHISNPILNSSMLNSILKISITNNSLTTMPGSMVTKVTIIKAGVGEVGAEVDIDIYQISVSR